MYVHVHMQHANQTVNVMRYVTLTSILTRSDMKENGTIGSSGCCVTHLLKSTVLPSILGGVPKTQVKHNCYVENEHTKPSQQYRYEYGETSHRNSKKAYYPSALYLIHTL